MMLGCASKRPPLEVPPVSVRIAEVTVKKNVDFEDFTGRTEAVESVDLKARATGYLMEVLFKDGDLVKKGQLLYQIDDRTYQAELDKLKSDIRRAQASADRYSSDLSRARRASLGDAISREEYDKNVAQRDEAMAQVDAAKAAAKTAELNLSFTKVLSPIDGKISKSKITKGNLVTADATQLTTIVSMDPIYAYYDVDERTVLRLQQMIREEISQTGVTLAEKMLTENKVDAETMKKVHTLLTGKIMDSERAELEKLLKPTLGEKGMASFFKILREHPKFRSYRDTKVKVFLGTQIEQGFPHEGFIDFVDNKIDANTGTLRVRGNFPNPRLDLSPGLFVRIRLPIGEAKDAIVVNERSLGSDQGLRFVYVIKDIKTNDKGEEEGTVEYRAVQVGSLRDGLRVVEEGLQSGEWIVIDGLQRARPDSKVLVSRGEMTPSGQIKPVVKDKDK
jgi:RND family efflux transporter MFP subunit